MYRMLVILLLTSTISHAQTIATFNNTDFPADKFDVKKEQRILGTVSVDIIHAKPKNQGNSKQFDCRVWLIVKDNHKLVKELAHDIESVGGCSGLFFPENQPSKDFVIISKFGDYDGRLYLVNRKGQLKDYIGGTFYVSNDKRYLFTNYDSDQAGVSIIDLTTQEVMFSGELKQYLANWYFQNGQYFAIVSADVTINGETELLHFDLTTRSFKTKRTKEKIESSYQLKAYNNVQNVPDCSCGK